jgi:hypothetical protein
VIFDHPKRRTIGEHPAKPLRVGRPVSAFGQREDLFAEWVAASLVAPRFV